MARGAGYTGGKTPKAMGRRREEDRKHGQRGYDSLNAFSLWKRLGALRPTPPASPRDPEECSDGDAIELARRGRGVARKSMETTPSVAYSQWRPYARLGRKRP